MRHAYPGSKVLGIALLTSGAVLIDSQPIIDSQSRGPIRGTFVAGRRLTEALERHLPKNVRLIEPRAELESL
jgi:hypothetical protein